MCQFFSFIYDADEKKFMYFDAKMRENVGDYSPDSHTSIATYFGYTGNKEDKLDKYEYIFVISNRFN